MEFIKQLESHLDTKLFTRHAKGVMPTDAAHPLLPYARQLTDDLSAIGNLFRHSKRRKPFRLGLIRSLGAERMGQLLTDFSNRVDGIELTLVEPDEPCDARIVTPSYVTEYETFQPMWQDEYLLAAPADHPIGLKTRASISELNRLPFIHRTPCEALDTLQKALQQERLELDIRARIQTLEYAQTMVQAGIGCALLPNTPHLRKQKQIRFMNIENLNMIRTIGIAYPSSQAQSKTHIELLNACSLTPNNHFQSTNHRQSEKI